MFKFVKFVVILLQLKAFTCDMEYIGSINSKHCFRNNDTMDVMTAEKSCNKFGGSLVKIANQLEEEHLCDLVKKLTDSVSQRRHWINGRNEPNTGNFRYFDGTLINYLPWPWFSKEPNAIGLCTGIHIHVVTSARNFIWFDDRCDDKLESFCEVSGTEYIDSTINWSIVKKLAYISLSMVFIGFLVCAGIIIGICTFFAWVGKRRSEGSVAATAGVTNVVVSRV